MDITHKEWCELTQKKFINKKLSKQHLNEIASEIKLIAGTEETLKELYDAGMQLFICSGSIDYLIQKILGKNLMYFEEIKANRFLFDRIGLLKNIVGTRFDFEGKANFIRKVAQENQIGAWEILFVGNSLNDEWAHESGAETLCVNPSMTNPDHPFRWTHTIRNMTNLAEIKKYITE